MELKIQPLIGLELTLRKTIILATAFAVLITTSIFLYTSLSSAPESFAGTTSWADQTCFEISDSEDKIYKYRLSDGHILDTMTLTGVTSPEASTLNLAGDTLWVLNSDELHYVVTSATSWTTTKVSGSDISAQTLTGALGYKSITDIDAMSVDVYGNIWAGSSSNDPSLLVVIDPSTGNVKEDYFGSGVDYLVVDNSAYSILRLDAMAFDPITNELYANMNSSTDLYDFLFKINTTTGEIELVNQFNTFSDVEGMTFDAVGDLYILTGATRRFGKVDLINGEVTEKYTVWGGDPETCDCLIGGAITAVEISGYVFYDTNDDTTFNSSDELGVTGFRVDLFDDINDNGIYDSGTDIFIDSTRTYADGYYRFRLKYTSGTENYVLVSNVSDMPTNNDYTTDNIEVASITAGRQIEANNNFGYVVGAMHSVNVITGTVFADANSDSTLQSASEVGVNGVKVYLFEDTDCDGVIDSGEALLDSTIVGTDGKYAFVQNYNPDTSIATTDSTISKRISSLTDDAQELSSGGMILKQEKLGIGSNLTGLRFQSLTIPQGATITNAYITFSTIDTSGPSTMTIYGQNTDDAPAFSSTAGDISSRSKTTDSMLWSPTSWNQNAQYASPNLKEIVNTIVHRTGWSSGNDMAFIISTGSGSNKIVHSFERTPSHAALLVVTYETEINYNFGDTVCYNTSVNQSTVPSDASMTTDNIESQQFTSGGNTSANNDFGLWGGALPVEWLTTDARWVPNGVEVMWSTASEENNSHFEIERTHDGAEWESIGIVTGAGFSSVINNYNFIDDNPYKDINYYRVKQVDFNGDYEYSDVVIVSNSDEHDGLRLKIYPNPANDHVFVQWNKTSRQNSVQVLDISGKILLNMSPGVSNTVRIDLTNFDTGIYFLKYATGVEETVKRLVIKH